MTSGLDQTRLDNTRLDNTTGAALIVEELVRLGVEHAVVCPGSRSTPLVAAIARHPRLRAHVLHDERGAGFFAVGLGRATGRPAVVVTTSGTAVANLVPAVVEADRDRVPLVVLTADRPPESHGTDANQTVDQQRFFGPRARRFLSVPPPEDAGPPAALLDALDDAIEAVGGPTPGPVHVNAMFRKPLEPTHAPDLGALPGLSAWARGSAPFTRRHPRALAISEGALGEVEAVLQRAERGLVIAGSGTPDEGEGALALAAALGWPLVADPLASVPGASPRSAPRSEPFVVRKAALLAKAGALPGSDAGGRSGPPDVVVWTGGVAISPDVSALAAGARVLVRVDARGRLRPEHAPGGVLVETSPSSLAASLRERAPFPPSALTGPLVEAERIARAFLEEELAREDDTLDEPRVALEVSAALPAALPGGGALFLGNSMPVRDVDLFGLLDRAPGTRVFANRGASGIDGLVSTAAGIAASGPKTVALLGDLSFLHDAGSLSALSRLSLDLRIVVVDNGGGGIFDFLPIARHDDLLERWFTTPHAVDLVALASAYGVPARRVSSRAALRDALTREVSGLELLVVPCARAGNVAAHRARYDALRERFRHGRGEAA